jgi:malate dehydrogenase (oxaloacetate-decarboxylating)
MLQDGLHHLFLGEKRQRHPPAAAGAAEQDDKGHGQHKERRDDPEYLGWRHERITGQAYFDFVDQFVQAVKQELPETCLQWEDFATPHARPILQRYRDELLRFNDDIQGTAAVVLGAILGAVEVTGRRLKDISSAV